MGTTFVRAFESAGIVATPKHFVANVGEGGRDSYPIDVSRRALEEIHFPPFKATIDQGHARSVMSAYNSVDGSPATQSRLLLDDILKREWNFSGFVISDAAATGGATVLHHTEASTATATKDAFEAGLDVVFQSSWPQHRPYLDAFQARPRRRLDHQRVGVARAEAPSSSSGCSSIRSSIPTARRAGTTRRSIARWRAPRRASRSCCSRTTTTRCRCRATARSIAVIGADATEARLGGYSGPGVQPVSILSGIRDAVGRTARGSLRSRSGTDHARVCDRRRRTIVERRQRSHGARSSRRVLRQQSAVRARRDSFARTRRSTSVGRSTRPVAEFRSTGIRFAGPASSPRPRPASNDSASRATTAIGSTSTASSSSTIGRSDRTARRSRASISKPDSIARHPARVLREHRQCAREARVGCRRAERLERDDSRGGRFGAQERRRDRRRRIGGGRVSRSRVSRSSGPSRRAHRARRGDRKTDDRRAGRRQRDHDVTVDRPRRAASSTCGIRASKAGMRSPTCCSATTTRPAACRSRSRCRRVSSRSRTTTSPPVAATTISISPDIRSFRSGTASATRRSSIRISSIQRRRRFAASDTAVDSLHDHEHRAPSGRRSRAAVYPRRARVGGATGDSARRLRARAPRARASRARCEFTVGPEQLRMLDRDMHWVVEPGAFRVLDRRVVEGHSSSRRAHGSLTELQNDGTTGCVTQRPHEIPQSRRGPRNDVSAFC